MEYKIDNLPKGVCFVIEVAGKYKNITYGTGGITPGPYVGLESSTVCTKPCAYCWDRYSEWGVRLATHREKEYLDECLKEKKVVYPIPDFDKLYINNSYELY